MSTVKQKSAAVILPLTGVKPLYRAKGGRTIVLEVNVNSLKQLNEPNTIDEMVAEARLEHAIGKTKKFTSAKALIKDLHS